MTTKKLTDYKAKPRIEPTYREGYVLGIDQSLASTGWAAVQGYYDHEGIFRFEVFETGMIITKPIEGLGGYYDTLARCDLLMDEYSALLKRFDSWDIAHEKPAEFGRRVDSSLCAALTLRNAAKAYYGRSVHMYGAQNVKKAVTDNGNAPKADVKAAVKTIIPMVVNIKPANEHTYDGCAIAIRHLRTN